jgi:hypothetical protein
MQMPSERDLLDAWEQALGRQPCERELTLLACVLPEMDRDTAMGLTIGQKNASLLTIRERVFGTEMTGTETCPACGDYLEFPICTSDLRISVPEAEADSFSFEDPDYSISFRVPSCADLIASSPGTLPGRDTILERCILTAVARGEPIPPAALPSDVIDAIVNRMREIDPQAETRISLTCPSCRHTWEAFFDIGLFFWEELSAWVNRMLSDVHLLASAYGWTERDVLAVSPLRRRYYLEWVSE